LLTGSWVKAKSDIRRQLANFIEENGAAVGKFKTADVLFLSPGKGSLDVSKQFALHKSRGDGAAVDFYQRTASTSTAVMNSAHDQFLTRASLAVDQHGRVC
jgi:hypothetical protein